MKKHLAVGKTHIITPNLLKNTFGAEKKSEETTPPRGRVCICSLVSTGEYVNNLRHLAVQKRHSSHICHRNEQLIDDMKLLSVCEIFYIFIQITFNSKLNVPSSTKSRGKHRQSSGMKCLVIKSPTAAVIVRDFCSLVVFVCDTLQIECVLFYSIGTHSHCLDTDAVLL